VTFSVVGRSADGSFGVAVSSSSPAVAARCAHVRSGVGAAVSQNVTDPRLGPALLDELAAGASARDAVERVFAAAPHAAHRQLGAIGAEGAPALRTGARALGRHGGALGVDCLAAGNLLASDDVLPAIVAAFDVALAGAPLGRRLTGALAAGLAAGGEAGPVRSAGLLVVDPGVGWPVADLRVDWHDDPIGELLRLWDVWEPQLGSYVTRALDPDAAPSYGVPGDDRPET
jgi:uncharacterized Ntn-hydrolase superfamily protein